MKKKQPKRRPKSSPAKPTKKAAADPTVDRATPKTEAPAETSSALTLKQLAVGAGVSERTLNTWIGRGCPRTSVEAVKEWQQNNVLPRKGGPRKNREAPGDQSQIALQQRLNEATATDKEESARTRRLKRRLLQRKLMLIAEGVREAGEIFTEMRAIIESIPDAVAKECPQQLRTRIYDVARNKITAAFKKLAALNSLGSDHAA